MTKKVYGKGVANPKCIVQRFTGMSVFPRGIFCFLSERQGILS